MHLVTKQLTMIPLPIRQTAQTLLLPEFKAESSDRYPSVGELGLPPPSAFQMLMPMTSTLSFPKHFPIFAKILRCLDDISSAYLISRATCPDEIQFSEIRQKVMTGIKSLSRAFPFFRQLVKLSQCLDF